VKLSESSIRNYIRRLIMETFYVGSEGDVMDKEQMEKQDPTFFKTGRGAKHRWGPGYHSVPAPPPDVPGEFKTFAPGDGDEFVGVYDTRLISAAKQDFENADPEHVRKLGTLMYGDPNILKSITFSDEDAAILPDINVQNEEGLRQGLELVYIIGDGFYDYMTHVYDLKEGGFGDFMRRQKSAGLTARGVGDITALGNDYPLAILFQPVKEGQVGMGKSLMDRIDRIIISALANLNNMTPIEFRDAVFPALESVIRKAYDRMPHIQRNLKIHGPALDDALEAYLEAINYVLGELIGEINFEYTYDPVGNEQMIFIPSDPQVRKKLDEYGQRHGSGYYPEEAVKSKVASAFSGNQTHGASPEDKVILRDIPNYYNMKFSVNPQEVNALQDQSERTLEWRMNMNFYFGVGLDQYNLDPEDYGIDSYDVGDLTYMKG
jgi:hypothetical protein